TPPLFPYTTLFRSPHKHRLLGLFARSTPATRNPRVSISGRMFRPHATIAPRVQPARQAQRELLAPGRHSHVRASRCHLPTVALAGPVGPLKVLLCNVSSKALVKSVLQAVVAPAGLTAVVPGRVALVRGANVAIP